MVGWRRSVLIRGSFFLNVVFALYVAVHIVAPPALLATRGLHGQADNLTVQSEALDYPTEEEPGLDEPSEPPAPPTPAPTLQEKVYPDLHSCHTSTLTPRPALHGNHWVLYNFVPADTQPACNESVTYTTHADFTFLDNLTFLVDRWRGPISVAVFSPGADFNATLKTIAYLRTCRPLVAKHVTFHLFFPADHMPSAVPPTAHALHAPRASCVQPAPYLTQLTYKRLHNLTYPVNIARNIARRAAATYFILASDVELYPSQDFIKHFMDMMQKQDASRAAAPSRRVYVLPIFEVKSGLRPPGSKLSLVTMLKRGSAIPFHKFVCPQCHKVPGMREWAESNNTDGFGIVLMSKRHPPYHRWEPIYVGTQREPLYDERLTWEGRSDKMTQTY
ncbi:unnamed protein product, partial [Meganyctiphanes norvegica]